jgi:hypothetical protein
VAALGWPARGPVAPAPPVPRRGFFWSHPEWWCLCGVAAAWAAILARGLGAGGCVRCASMGTTQAWTHWMLMVVAMMVPVQLDAVRHAAFRSLPERRHCAMALFFVGYLAPWAALGLAAAWLCTLPWARGPWAAPAAFVVAAVWAMTAWRWRAVLACHRRVPLAPYGWRADVHCLRFGGLVGGACVGSCWATMLGCALSGHALPIMVGGAAIAAIERASFRVPVRAAAIATLGLALGAALLAH